MKHRQKSTHYVFLSNHPLKLYLTLLLSLCLMAFFFGCSGGGSSSTDTETGTTTAEQVANYKMPTEISAVPSKTNESVSDLTFSKAIKAIAKANKAATDSDTDYSRAITRKYVEENTLKQFDMIETILNAVAQTNYSDQIGNGPYKAMVAFNEEENGVEVKSLETWVVQADAIVEEGVNALRIRAWVEEDGHYVKGEFKIYASPVQNADGSYADYGEWVANVKFDETGINNFYALSCESGDNGAILKVHEKNTGFEEGEPKSESKAVMYRGEASGYGRVSYPDYEAYWGPEGNRSLTSYPVISALYAYNDTYLTVQKEDENPVYKSRNTVMNMTHRYGIFNNDTGDDIIKSKSFGFPIRYNDGEQIKHSYYGAWQGRHQIWTNGNPIPEGTVVTREDTPPEEVETYTMGPTFNGVLVRRDLVDATLDDIKNIPVEIWINNDYNLTYSDGSWMYCKDINWESFPDCREPAIDFDAEIGLKILMVDPNDFRKNVHINGFDITAENNDNNKSFVYLVAGSYDFDGDGENEITIANEGDNFYEASESNGKLVPKTPLAAIIPENYEMLWVWMGGSVYVEYDGKDWVEKELLNFDERTWTPEFGENDKAFKLPEGKEMYINMQGANYIVNQTNTETTVKLELQTAVNPANAATIIPDGPIFKDQWNPDSNSTYEFITDPNAKDPNDNTKSTYMMLVFKTIGENHMDRERNPEPGVAVGSIATNVWGISAEINGTETAFNWEYSEEGNWGSVSYLLNDNDEIIYLDEALQFNPITLTNGAGDSKTLSLRFDGWMSGLPDMYHELEKNGWNITEDISNKVINIPAGTLLTESSTGTGYILKPLEISQFLVSVAAPSGADAPDITAAQNLDLDSVPDYEEHNMGDVPTEVVTLYSEGLPIE